VQVCGQLRVLASVNAQVISLAQARRDLAERRQPVPPAAFYFDLGDPFTYLAAERVHRALPGADWVPTAQTGFHRGPQRSGRAGFQLVTDRARALDMPLAWPDVPGRGAAAANRAATYAAERGQGAEFALAASRLAYCGGFDLGSPEVLAEAAAAATVDLDGCLRAARDLRRDRALEHAARSLLAGGAHVLPTLSVGARLFAGEERLAAALACVRGELTAAP